MSGTNLEVLYTRKVFRAYRTETTFTLTNIEIAYSSSVHLHLYLRKLWKLFFCCK